MNFFIQMRESVIDIKFYRSIKNNKFSRSFVYLLLLFLIIYSINGTKTYLGTKIIMEEMADDLKTNVPEFRLENGEFSFEGEMPHYISSSINELFVIDTTGKVTVSELKDVDTAILITRDKVYFKRSKLETREFNLTELKGFTLTKTDVLELMPKLSIIVAVFLAFGFIFALGWKLINAAIMALLGLIANTVFKGKLKFGNLMNICIYAITLPMLLQLAVNLYGYPIPNSWMIYWVISILYEVLAIKSCIDEEKESEDTTGEDRSYF